MNYRQQENLKHADWELISLETTNNNTNQKMMTGK